MAQPWSAACQHGTGRGPVSRSMHLPSSDLHLLARHPVSTEHDRWHYLFIKGGSGRRKESGDWSLSLRSFWQRCDTAACLTPKPCPFITAAFLTSAPVKFGPENILIPACTDQNGCKEGRSKLSQQLVPELLLRDKWSWQRPSTAF